MILKKNNSSNNIFEQELDITKRMRAEIKMQRPCIIWLTGLSCSGKSTIANRLEQDFYKLNKHTYILDGDNVRFGLNKDLRFSAEDRRENIRRISEVARLMVDAGLIVIVAAISPFKSEREFAKQLVSKEEFIEVFVNTPLEVCEQRDIKGLYKKARMNEVINFTGINSPYEVPTAPDIVIDTTITSAEEASERILAHYFNEKR